MSLPPLPFKVKTVYSWSGEQEEDLGFVENEIVDVYSIVDDSWWKGKLRRNNAEGIFPKDFVEIIEDSIPQSSSSRSISQLNSKQNTPVKDQELRSSKNGTPNGFYNKSKFPNKKINPLNNVDLNNSYEDYDYSYDNSFDNSFGHINRSSNGYSPQKLRGSNSNLSPRKQQINTQDDLIEVHTPAQAQKEKEKVQIKMLQQQQQQLQQQLQEQQRLLKKQQYDQQIRTRQQQDNYRNSIAVTPDYHYNNTYAKQKPKQMKQRPISQYHQYANNPYEFNSPAGLMPHSPPYQEKSHSYTDVNELSPSKSPSKYQPVFQNNTIESFSPEASHNQKRRNAQKYSNHYQKFYDPIYDTAPEIVDDGLDDPEYEDLLLAKQRIELEYQRIKQLEKRKKTALKSTPPPPPIPKYSDPIYDHSGESSYVSEDLLSSKKNQSRENLSKKLTNYVTDEDTYEIDNNLYRGASPPPPPPPKHGYGINAGNGYEPIANINQKSRSRMPYDPNDFEVSPLRQQYSDDLYGISDMSPEDLKQSIKSLQSDVLNLSELSATSAGSFMRHKQDKQLQNADYKMRGLSLNEEDEEDKDDEDEARDQMPDRGLMESMFEDKKKPSLFKKFLNKRKGVDNYLGMDDEMDWATLKTDLNRMNSLSTHDKQLRTRRIVREESSIIIKPLDYIGEANVNETTEQVDDADQVISDFENVSFKKADKFISAFDSKIDINELITDISVKFNSSKVNQIRCVLMHLCKFRIIEEPNKIMQIKPKLAEVLYKGEASIYQLNYLFKKILDALRIRSELVLGFWKKPNEYYHIEQYVINHCWLSIAVEGRIYMMDLYCFKNGSVFNLKNPSPNFNEHYFLTKPMCLVSTHIPPNIDLQHVIPPVDHSIAFHLPRQYSGFHRNRLHIRNFNTALTMLKDLEIFEFEIDIPTDVELFTLVKTAKLTTNELSLCQVFWKKNDRIAKIKAVLPEKESIGVLQVFAGPKGLQEHFENIHELAVVIPLSHNGTSKPGKFVPRFPSSQSQNNDLYIKQPQTNKIVAKNSYNFEVLQHPSKGLNSGSGLMNQDFKLIVKSPSGKHYRLVKDDPLSYGTYEVNIKCQEVGTYTGLVIGDSGSSWTVFAQWECVSSI
ncbi:hypothetical protein HYPBUDRAFT_156641 [Hyphopichia burtonii NRRL Y-1933]|uniref:SH3 domain-containing protein n=1 Tax=Hyphopichia burtonii NRRL Y-1933 TaxID=984485 RepID=A0A1E4RL12_9ASCO|nr:hypothetical protein HYPBUDRAFT_156641 [Hyphopichia burtonii NRRL Y-1933]ODV67926.1 hypothetical protein HYPBUDRAFT_156641 [Hyphopichia burtonii NRRL Y-1933]